MRLKKDFHFEKLKSLNLGILLSLFLGVGWGRWFFSFLVMLIFQKRPEGMFCVVSGSDLAAFRKVAAEPSDLGVWEYLPTKYFMNSLQVNLAS